MNQIQYAPCPKCGKSDAKKVGYTLWGGALGPIMFTHVKCNVCGTQYNGKTGQSNQQNIIIYLVVSTAAVFCLCGGLALLSYLLNQN
jgi:transposase-like protein